MSIQSIIDRCNSLQINRRKLVGIQYTRNEIPRVSETPTKNPWKFTITMPNSLTYIDARSIIESLDTLDRRSSEVITFNNNSNMNWIFRYQGNVGLSQIQSMKVTSFIGDQLVLDTLPPVASTKILFEPNDLIQIGTYPFPFTSTTQVLRGTGSTVTVTTHRPNIISDDVTALTINAGAGCQFRIFCPNMPTYILLPGGSRRENGILVNNAYIEWSNDFELYEFVGLS